MVGFVDLKKKRQTKFQKKQNTVEDILNFKIFFKKNSTQPVFPFLEMSFFFWKGHLPQIVSYLIIQRFENYGEGIASAD